MSEETRSVLPVGALQNFFRNSTRVITWRTPQQYGEDLKRLLLELDLQAPLPQFGSVQVGFKDSKANQ